MTVAVGRRVAVREGMASSPGVIGKGIQIKGELKGSGDLVIEGHVEGRVELASHLVIESTGIVHANIAVDRVTIHGHASGNIEATERVEVKAAAVVSGDIRAPTVVIEDGALFTGNIQMDVGIPNDL